MVRKGKGNNDEITIVLYFILHLSNIYQICYDQKITLWGNQIYIFKLSLVMYLSSTYLS